MLVCLVHRHHLTTNLWRTCHSLRRETLLQLRAGLLNRFMHEPSEEQGERKGRHALSELGNRRVGLEQGEDEGVDEVEGIGEDADLADPGPVEEAEG